MNSEPIRVIIADDHTMIRSGLRLFLMAFEDLKMVGEAANGEEAIRMCVQAQPDIVLMDLVMPTMDGIQATRAIRERFPHVQVVGLTTFAEAELIQEMLDAGAISFLMKNVSAAELANAIRDAHAGKPVISGDIRTILSSHPSSGRAAGQIDRYNLSAREREVLACMVAGLSNAAISQELVISLSTAKYHVSSILIKLGVSSRAEAISAALQEGLVVPRRKAD